MRTIFASLETYENVEDACRALTRKQNGRKNTDEFFIEFLRADEREIIGS